MSKFEYYMNALHYCLFLRFVHSHAFWLKMTSKILRLFSDLFDIKEWYYRVVDKNLNDVKGQEILFSKEYGFSIGWAHHWFGYFYSGYSVLLSFILLGIFDGMYGNLSKLVVLIILAFPIAICYIPAYKAVFSKDKYLKYFKQFEKKDASWHKKWKWITIAFCIGSVVVSLLGICVALGILFFNK